MKKLTVLITLLFCLAVGASAQNGGGLFQKGPEPREYGSRTENDVPMLPTQHGETSDQSSPLGSGAAIMLGLGAAYLVGKKRKSVRKAATMLSLLILMPWAAMAQTQTLYTSYTASSGTAGANGDQGYAKLLDNNINTKWCVTDFYNGGGAYVEFQTTDPIIPKQYVLTTADDNATFAGRNPRSWKIKAKISSSDEWTEIVNVSNDYSMGNSNFTDYTFPISNDNNTAYQYFRFEVTQIQSTSWAVMQLSEFKFWTIDLPSLHIKAHCIATTATTATLSWNEIGQTDSWQICLNGDESNLIDANSNPFTLTGLTEGTLYTAKVRPIKSNICGSWSDEISFIPANERHLTLYDGNDTNTSIPIYSNNYQYYAYSAFIIPASALTDLVGCTIQRLVFYSQYPNKDCGTTDFKVLLRHTTQTTFTRGITLFLFGTNVYTGRLSVNADHQMVVTFDHPFTYNQADNLQISFEQTIASNIPSIYWYGCDQPHNNYDYGPAITDQYDGSNHHSGLRWFLPKVTFDYIPAPKRFVTEGNWDVSGNWSPEGVPTIDDKVIIAANATIPSGYTAYADKITFEGTPTLTIAEGGQLFHNNADVEATMQKSITGYNDGGGWNFIASPVTTAYTPSQQNGLISGIYDLYYYDEPSHYWRNYKTNNIGFNLNNGQGYLYANEAAASSLAFTGILNSTNADPTMALTASAENLTGFNLVGNPFARNLSISDLAIERNGNYEQITSIYEINGNNVVINQNPSAIAPCTGFMIHTDDAGTLHFNHDWPDVSQSHQGSLRIEVSTSVRGSSLIDRAYINFGEGRNIKKFTLRESDSRLCITQDGQEHAIANAEATGELPLNFLPEADGTYTLSFESEAIEFSYLHLIDNMTGADVDLMVTPSYTFEARYSDYASRFRLVFSAGSNNAVGGNETFAFIDVNGNIIVTDGPSTGSGTSTLQIMDMMGRVIRNTDVARNVSTSEMAPGVYVLRLIDGETVRTQKIVID